MRVRVSTSRRPIATTIATPIVIAWWMVIVVGPRSIGALVREEVAIGRLTPGFQISWARPIMNSSSEIETTSFTVFGRVLEPTHDHELEQHAEQRSQDTSSTTTSASGAGQPQSKRSCQ